MEKNTYSNNEIDLIDQLKTLWDRKLILLGIVVLYMFIRFAVLLLLPDMFNVVMIMKSPYLVSDNYYPTAVLAKNIVAGNYDGAIIQKLDIKSKTFLNFKVEDLGIVIKVSLLSKKQEIEQNKKILDSLLKELEIELAPYLANYKASFMNEINKYEYELLVLINKIKNAEEEIISDKLLIEHENKNIIILENRIKEIDLLKEKFKQEKELLEMLLKDVTLPSNIKDINSNILEIKKTLFLLEQSIYDLEENGINIKVYKLSKIARKQYELSKRVDDEKLKIQSKYAKEKEILEIKIEDNKRKLESIQGLKVDLMPQAIKVEKKGKLFSHLILAILLGASIVILREYMRSHKNAK